MTSESERETKPSCPACEGTGSLTLESGAHVHRGVICPLCRGDQVVTKVVARAFAIGQKHPRSTAP